MSIRFVPARSGDPSLCMVIWNGGETRIMRAANDNPWFAANDGAAFKPMFRDFGTAGFGAAKAASDYALAAHASGDLDGYSRWLSVCRVLDRRLARSLAEKVACDV
jgi:hypothetical protein